MDAISKSVDVTRKVRIFTDSEKPMIQMDGKIEGKGGIPITCFHSEKERSDLGGSNPPRPHIEEKEGS